MPQANIADLTEKLDRRPRPRAKNIVEGPRPSHQQPPAAAGKGIYCQIDSLVRLEGRNHQIIIAARRSGRPAGALLRSEKFCIDWRVNHSSLGSVNAADPASDVF